MSLPKEGRTVYAHVEHLMADATAILIGAGREIRSGKKMSKAKRIELWRDLAGVVSDVESVRLWLEGGRRNEQQDAGGGPDAATDDDN